MPTVNEIASYAASGAEALGIKKYDIYGSSVDENSVQVDQGKPKQVKASNRASVIVRVWNDDNTIGVTSTTDVDPNGIQLALKTAFEASAFGPKENVPDFSPEATAPIADQGDRTASQAPVSDLITTLLGAEKQLMAAHEAIAGVPYNGLSQRDIDKFYLNSDGALRHEQGSYASMYLYSKTEQDGRKPRSAGAYRVTRSLDKLDVEGCLQEAAEKTISHLDYDKIPTGKYRVVFSPEAFLSLFGAFGNLFNAQSILDNQSLSTSDSLGEQVASPLLSVCDDALHPENVAVETFDGEGTPTRRVPILTDGVLTSFIHSAGTAKRMNTEPTGNANIGAKVTISPNFYHIFPGQAASETYSLDTAENVILVDDLSALHAGVKALQGSFSLPFDGWLINKGDRRSIDSAVIAGDIREVLKSIIFVESEVEITPGGICPRVWVEGMSITCE
ncbi:MAG: TldD/PmbA family protein [Merismopedia sp. SIO2A8]|nr:TldD/PmbA family protein [Symploca sp. SIO2B6]NET50453.1 TldD/PmbA family protein [Merismopedia sp. SIO2A8]